MAKRVEANEIVKDNFWENYVKSTKNARESTDDLVNQLNAVNSVLKEIKSTASTIKSGVLNLGKGSTSDLDKRAQSQRIVNKLDKDATLLEKERLRIEKDLEKQRLSEIKLQKERERAFDRFEAKAKKEADAYHRLSSSAREMKNEAKRLHAEMLLLASAGDKNTTKYKALEAEFNSLTSQTKKLDAQLKHIDATQGDHFRSVGNYEKAVNGLRGSLIKLAGAFSLGFALKNIGETELKLQSMRVALSNVIGDNEQYAKSLEFISKLSKDYGQDLVVLTDTYKNFIASSQSSGLEFKERERIYASIVKAGGALHLNNEQLEGSLLAVSQMFSKGKVSAEELRGQLGERLPGAFGLMAKAMGVSEVELNKMLETGEVMAKDALPLLATELEKTYGEKAQGNLKTIGGAWNVLNTKISEYVSDVNKGGRITEWFAGLISGLANNIESVINWVVRLTAVYVIFKAQQKIVNSGMIDFTKNLFKSKKAVQEVGTATQEAGSKSKAFGNALKGIGFAVAIDLAFELGAKLWDIGTGADYATRKLNEMNAGMERGDKHTDKVLGKLDKLRDKEIKALEIRKSKGLINQAEFNKQSKIIEDNYRKAIIERRDFDKESLDYYRKQLKSALEAQKVVVPKKGFFDNLSEGLANKMGISQFSDEIIMLNGKVKEFSTTVKNYNLALDESDNRMHDLTVSSNESKEEFKRQGSAGKKAGEEIKKSYKSANDEIERMINLQKETSDLIDEIALDEASKNLDFAVKTQLDNVNEGGQYNIDAIQLRIDEERKLREAIIERQYLEAIDLATNEQEVINAKIRRDYELGKLDEEYLEKKKSILEQLNEAQEKFTDKDKQLSDEELKRKQQRLEDEKALADLLTEYYIKKSNERIAQLNKEEEKAKQNADNLRELANSGNINAQQSIIEQEKRANDLAKAKERELKNQARIQLAKSVFDTYQAKVSANDQNALGSTIKDISVLQAFINSLPKFYHGTEDTGDKGVLKDQFGVITGVTHAKERVFNANDNKAFNGASNSEVVDTFIQMRKLDSIKGVKTDYAGKSMDVMPLISKIDELNRTIQNKPETNIEIETITNSVLNLVRQTRTGNTITTTKHRFSS